MEEKKPLAQNGEIILYQPDSSIRLEVRMEEDTVWLTQAQMAVLFGCSQDNIGGSLFQLLLLKKGLFYTGITGGYQHSDIRRI